MKKNIFGTIFIAIIMVIVFINIFTQPKVTMRVEEDSFEVGKLVLILRNNTDTEVLYGRHYILEKYEDGEWEELDTVVGGGLFNLDGYSLFPNAINEVIVNITEHYGKLTNGRYRIVKGFLLINEEFNVYAEFTVKE